MSSGNSLAKLKDLAVSETGFVFDPHTGATFTTNLSGVAILRALQEGHGRDGVAGRLEEAFEVSGVDIQRDLDEFIQLLRDNAIVPRNFALDDTSADSATG